MRISDWSSDVCSSDLDEARALGSIPPRIFGSAPGTYGSGIEEKLSDGSWDKREELGRIYLDATSHSFSGADGDAIEAHGRFADRVEKADLLVHTGDDPGRDLLDEIGRASCRESVWPYV